MLDAERLDLAVKWRLFAVGDTDAERVYRWHIQHRTGGIERRSWKTTVDDYVTAAGTLRASMREHGFVAKTPVVLGSNGRLMDGAHRLSCALALGLPAVAVHRRTDKPGRAAPWGRGWFLQRGIAAADLNRIQTDMEHLTR